MNIGQADEAESRVMRWGGSTGDESIDWSTIMEFHAVLFHLGIESSESLILLGWDIKFVAMEFCQDFGLDFDMKIE